MRVYMLLSVYQEDGFSSTGADLQARTQIRSLQAKGHKITVIAKKRTWQSRYHEIFNGVEIYRLWPPGLRTIFTVLILLFCRRKCDIVHVHGQHIFGTAAIGLCKFLGIPSVLKITIAGRIFVRLSADRLFPRKLRPFRRLVNLVSRKASAYLAISKEISEQLRLAGFNAKRIVQIPNGVDMNRFHPVQASEKNELRNILGLPVDKPIVLYAARLIYRKGFDILLKTWPAICKEFPECCLVVVGDGSATAVKELDEMSRTTDHSEIIYIGEVKDIASYLQCADIFIFPSRQEGLPNTLIEAMACGTACVASNIGGCTDLIEPGKTGILFTDGSAADLSNAVISLLPTRQEIADLGQNAFTHIKENYDINKVADQLNNLYISLTSDTEQSPATKTRAMHY